MFKQIREVVGGLLVLTGIKIMGYSEKSLPESVGLESEGDDPQPFPAVTMSAEAARMRNVSPVRSTQPWSEIKKPRIKRLVEEA